jgi:hypothetical protein
MSEGNALIGEFVNVRSIPLRMAPQITNPVIEVIDRDKKNIGRV